MHYLGNGTGPRYLDPDHADDVAERTLIQYRRAAQSFIRFLDEENNQPDTVEEWDDLLVEYSLARKPTLSQLRLTFASIDFQSSGMRSIPSSSKVQSGSCILTSLLKASSASTAADDIASEA